MISCNGNTIPLDYKIVRKLVNDYRNLLFSLGIYLRNCLKFVFCFLDHLRYLVITYTTILFINSLHFILQDSQI